MKVTCVIWLSNASRTMLFIYDKKWDEELCSLLNILNVYVTEVKDSSCIFAYTVSEYFFGKRTDCWLLVTNKLLLFDNNAWAWRQRKRILYGTGCFMLMNTGNKPHPSKHGLLQYCLGLSGSTYLSAIWRFGVCGCSAVQWFCVISWSFLRRQKSRRNFCFIW